jgi:hypothetical protein
LYLSATGAGPWPAFAGFGSGFLPSGLCPGLRPPLLRSRRRVKTGAFNHSATPPEKLNLNCILAQPAQAPGLHLPVLARASCPQPRKSLILGGPEARKNSLNSRHAPALRRDYFIFFIFDTKKVWKRNLKRIFLSQYAYYQQNFSCIMSQPCYRSQLKQ